MFVSKGWLWYMAETGNEGNKRTPSSPRMIFNSCFSFSPIWICLVGFCLGKISMRPSQSAGTVWLAKNPVVVLSSSSSNEILFLLSPISFVKLSGSCSCDIPATQIWKIDLSLGRWISFTSTFKSRSKNLMARSKASRVSTDRSDVSTLPFFTIIWIILVKYNQ